jgi:hypothetical protein
VSHDDNSRRDQGSSSTIGGLDALHGRESNCLSDRQNGHRPVSDHALACRGPAGRLGRIMRDLAKRGTIAAPPKGLAFEIADLVLARNLADRHDFRMLVRLDHGAAVGEEYEEVITFQTNTSPLYRLTMWRNAETVFVQPLVGRGKQYRSVAAALTAQFAPITDARTASAHPNRSIRLRVPRSPRDSKHEPAGECPAPENRRISRRVPGFNRPLKTKR